LDEILREKAEMSSALETNSDRLERSAQFEADSRHKSDRLSAALHRLLITSRGQDPRQFPEDFGSSLDLGSSLDQMDRDVQVLGEIFGQEAKEKKTLFAQNAELQHKVANLEDRLKMLQKEKAVGDECNARYDIERKDLNTAIATLKPALEDMKARFTAADDERKQLKSEVERLSLETARPS
jgi:DNA repair exonuclease SbcCD ATPase subunit